MTSEERREFARKQRQQFNKATQADKRAGRVSWKNDGKVILYLHPTAEIHNRRRHWLPVAIEQEKVERRRKIKVKKLVNLPFNCPGEDVCPVCKFRADVKENSAIELDDVVLEFKAGRDTQEWTKGDVIGTEGYDYKRDLYARADFVTVAVVAENASGAEPDEVKAEIFDGAKSLGNRINKEIDSEIEEHDEEVGNPWINPYPFKLTFDGSKPPSDMYSAHALITRKPTPKVKEALDGPAPSLKDEVSTEGMVEKLAEIVLAADITGTIEPPKATRSSKAKVAKPAAGAKEQPGVEEEELPAEPEPFDCTECGRELNPDATECPECGTKFEFVDDEEAPF